MKHPTQRGNDKTHNPFAPVAWRQIRALRRLRDLHPDMTVLQGMFLFAVAAMPGATQREIYEFLDTNDSNGSRTLAILSDIGGRKTAPLGLIDFDLDPTDRRVRLMSLSAKGQRLMADIMSDHERVIDEIPVAAAARRT